MKQILVCRYSSYCLNLDRYREIAHFYIGMNQRVEYKPFYLTCCSKACRDGNIDDAEQINKQDGIVNKTFVEMLDKPGYDIRIKYVKKDQ